MTYGTGAALSCDLSGKRALAWLCRPDPSSAQARTQYAAAGLDQSPEPTAGSAGSRDAESRVCQCHQLPANLRLITQFALILMPLILAA